MGRIKSESWTVYHQIGSQSVGSVSGSTRDAHGVGPACCSIG